LDVNFGLSTEAEIKAFQKAAGLLESGEVDNATWRKLLGLLPPLGPLPQRLFRVPPGAAGAPVRPRDDPGQSQWRPPRKDNDRGWKRVANGELLKKGLPDPGKR
jgi:peptidoglycan hydrolase-like protein with peptidoglycan-binding domain